MRKKDNIQRFTDRINRCQNPRAMLAALYVVLSALKGNYDAATPEVIYNVLEGKTTEHPTT